MRTVRQSGWRRAADRARAFRLPLPLERVFGAEAPLWVILLITAPIVTVGLVLTVGLRVNELPFVDNDYWWHLATGEWILDNGRVPSKDPFSWTFFGKDWVAHEWLAALLLTLADRVAGYAAGISLVVVVVVAGFLRLVTGMRLYGMSRRAICILILLWGGVFLREGVIVVRPQVLTFALLAVLLTELAAYETGRRRVLWLLPPLFAIWANMNLTVLIGGLCLAAFALDRLFRRTLDRHLVIVCALSAFALLLNPRGPELLLAVLKYQDSDAIWYRYVYEWMKPELSDPTHLPFVLALPVIPLAVWQLLTLRIWPAVPVLVLAYQSFTAIRFIPLFVMLAWLFAAWLVRRTAQDRRTRSSAPAVPILIPRVWWAPAVAAVAVAFVVVTALRTEASQFRREPIARGLPVEATTILLDHFPDARLFNVYDYGGYLIYRFDGQKLVYVDGRGEMFGDAFLRDYFDLIGGGQGWEETFANEGINAVLIRNVDGLNQQIQQSTAWQLVYNDGISSLYIKIPVEEAPSRIGS